MAKTLFIVDDDVFGAMPDAVQKKLLDEVKNIFSFIPQFKVETRKPALFPAILDFTDSAVQLVNSDDEVTPAANDIQRQEDSNIRFSITQTQVHLKINPLSLSPAGDPDRGGVGGNWKTTVVEGGGRTVSLTMTWGVASIETAEQAVVDEELHGRSLQDVLNERRKAVEKKGLAYYSKHEALISVREEMEAELMTKRTPLKDWPTNLWDDVATALARLVAHEARHQYIVAHAAKGLGAESARIWGDPNFEQFDGSDKANILTAIHDFSVKWNSAGVHLETCPNGKPSPFG